MTLIDGVQVLKQTSTDAVANLEIKYDKADLKIYGPRGLVKDGKSILKRTAVETNTWHSMQYVFDWSKRSLTFMLDKQTVGSLEFLDDWDELDAIVTRGFDFLFFPGVAQSSVPRLSPPFPPLPSV
jgi:hypothetical protein